MPVGGWPVQEPVASGMQSGTQLSAQCLSLYRPAPTFFLTPTPQPPAACAAVMSSARPAMARPASKAGPLPS